ncbi:MAG TPA: protocatechuate 3,4-dioxygenase, partial [Roseimicrobium sp.]|nr:protocatechuate 3,4-dioxygenase [Roseimicrobium sp.]
VGATAATAHWFFTPGAFAAELARTPAQTEGPFYPNKLPLDTDNDLLIINDKVTPAVGAITHLTGRVLDASGEPIRNALVEIWQCDNNGAYIHSGSINRDKRDGNFQGYGRFLTGSTGSYYFRTIKPVAYPGRTPHIHVAISRGSRRVLTTQALINGHPQNNNDMVVRGVTDPRALKNILLDFKPLEGSKTGELSANFEIILGTTPADPSTQQQQPTKPGPRSPMRAA